jgi:hypothetical protein
MKPCDPETLRELWHDADAREVLLRATVQERLDASPPPRMDDHIVASYFFAFRTTKLQDAVAEISYHATSGIKDPRRARSSTSARRGRRASTPSTPPGGSACCTSPSR